MDTKKKFCTECGHECNSDNKFCSQCGFCFEKDAKISFTKNSKFFKPILNPEYFQEHQKLREKKKRKSLSWFLGCAIGMFILLVGILFGGSQLISIISCGLGAVIMLICGMNYAENQELSQKEYESLPGAIDSRGEHQCVKCGNKGIHKHSAYKNPTVFSDCSKCGTVLYAKANIFYNHS